MARAISAAEAARQSDARALAMLVEASAPGRDGLSAQDVADALGQLRESVVDGTLKRLRRAGHAWTDGGRGARWFASSARPKPAASANQQFAPLSATWTCALCGRPRFLGASPRRHVGASYACAPKCAPAEAPVRETSGLPTLTAPELPKRAGAWTLTPPGGVDLGDAPVGESWAVIDGRRVRVTRAPLPANWRPATPASA